MAKKPKVLVFDLDYTLWPFYCDTHIDFPIKKSSSGHIVDYRGSKVDHYPNVTDIIADLHSQGYKLAVASRTGEIKGARQLIDLFGWQKYFSHQEIYPGCKVKHLTNIRDFYKVDFNEIIFFDDEGRNIKDVSALGVLSILVRDGVTKQVVQNALNEFAKR